MAVIAGIDEAGYGPRLGPLVSSCAAIGVPEKDESGGPLPCLWERLNEVVGRPGGRARKDRPKLLVGDSKALYIGGGTLAGLEAPVLGCLAAADGRMPDRPETLVARLTSGACRASLAEHPWYADRGESLPLDAGSAELGAMTEGLLAGCRATDTRVVCMTSRVLAEAEYNRRVARTDNKATVLAELVIELLREARCEAGRELLVVHVDRLGGRTDYAPILVQAFPNGFVWQLDAPENEQAYRVDGLAGPTVVKFRIKADRDCFSTALASMVSKYLREVHMRRFNAWWREVDPGIPPTSGYHADAGPFLAAAERHMTRLGIAENMLVRSR